MRKMKREHVMNDDDIWNAMIDVMASYEFPTEHITGNRLFLVYHYYSELESGGHESLFTQYFLSLYMKYNSGDA